MKLLRNKFFYVCLAMVFIATLLILLFIFRDTDTKPVSSPTQDTSSDSAQQTTTPQSTYRYQLIDITAANINQVPSCCKDFYKPTYQALVLDATSPDGKTTTRYWYNTQAGGTSSFEFIPQTGSDNRIFGTALPKSINDARRDWTRMKYKSGGHEEDIQVANVDTAIKFIQINFAAIPSVGDAYLN